MNPHNSREKPISVRCYSGYKANEKPVSFSFDDTVLTVVELLDRWYGPDYAYFKLTADDGNLYILRYNERNDEWRLHYFEHTAKTDDDTH